MQSTKSTKLQLNNNQASYNWPVVGFLLFMTGIPALPAFFIVSLVLINTQELSGMASFINATYFKTPAAIVVHGVSGILFFLTMPFQFSPALRERHIHWHKSAGKVAVLAGYILAISGVWMHHVLAPGVFGAAYMSLVIMSATMCLSFTLALWHILHKNIDLHKKWMVRSVAVTLAVVTPLFVEIIAYVLFGQFEHIYTAVINILNDYDRIICIVINLTVVEWCYCNQSAKQNSGKLYAQ